MHEQFAMLQLRSLKAHAVTPVLEDRDAPK